MIPNKFLIKHFKDLLEFGKFILKNKRDSAAKTIEKKANHGRGELCYRNIL